MTTIANAYVNALLADATYVDLFNNPLESPQNQVALGKRLTPTQAAYLATNFEVVSSVNSSDIPLFGSGFDATVWRGKADGEFAGQVFVSARGTEPEAGGADLLADGDLALQVGATSQIIDMVNWWLRESTPTGQQARQIKWDTLRQPDPQSLQIVPGFVNAASVAGTGGAVGISSVQINGHSLGGHMASAFARIFGGSTGQTGSVNVQAITTFNSAGFNGNNAEPIFQGIQSPLGSGTSSFDPIRAKQTNYFAQNGVSFTTNSLADMRLPGFGQYGRCVAAPVAVTSCQRAKRDKRFTTNSIAACTHKKSARGRSDYLKQSARSSCDGSQT